MKKGFTLIELLVVVAIIGVLASVVLASLNGARSRARDSQRITSLRNLQTALELYHVDNGSYPTKNPDAACSSSWSALSSLVEDYISELPVDPINRNNVDGKNFCYNYVSSSSPSGWYCDGRRRTDYEYAFVFSLESENTTIPQITSLGNPDYFTHCILGPEK